MKIYIPTRGRTDRQSTWDELPPDLQEQALLVCPAEEVEVHRKYGRNAIACPVEGIIRKRQFILDNCHERFMAMLDDDLIFLRRKSPAAWNLRRCESDDVLDLFAWAQSLVEDYAQVGVSPRQGNNRFYPDDLVFNNRVTNFHVYDVPVIKALGIKFHDSFYPETFTMEDFHVSLSLLQAGYQNAIITDFAWDQFGSNTSGGCSLYRTSDTQAESAHLLSLRHPGFVRVTEKETKGGWFGVANGDGAVLQGGIRTDVVISWKKAYEHGALVRKVA